MRKFAAIFLTVSVLLAVLSLKTYAQPDLQIANIGNFKTQNGDIIKDCKIGYRTIGKLNRDRSNVVLWPTWFQGTSGHIIDNGLTTSIIDTSGLYIILVDALTNGVSSSPSNTPGFPDITIRDMVNSQHILLVHKLGINHLLAVMGISMGGMQTFEWVVAYPDFMDKAIPVVGTPEQSSFDILVWQTMADLITEAGNDEQKLEFAYRHAHNILLMNLNTPALFATSHTRENLNEYLENAYTVLMEPEDYLGGLKAMISHDIFKSAGTDINGIKDIIKAEMLIIISKQDHLVNPISSIKLSEELNARVVTLTGDCGHTAFGCETEIVRKAIVPFLEKK